MADPITADDPEQQTQGEIAELVAFGPLSVAACVLMVIVGIPVAFIPIFGAILLAGLAIVFWFTYIMRRRTLWLTLALISTVIVLISVGVTLWVLPTSTSVTQITQFRSPG